MRLYARLANPGCLKTRQVSGVSKAEGSGGSAALNLYSPETKGGAYEANIGAGVTPGGFFMDMILGYSKKTGAKWTIQKIDPKNSLNPENPSFICDVEQVIEGRAHFTPENAVTSLFPTYGWRAIDRKNDLEAKLMLNLFGQYWDGYTTGLDEIGTMQSLIGNLRVPLNKYLSFELGGELGVVHNLDEINTPEDSSELSGHYAKINGTLLVKAAPACRIRIEAIAQATHLKTRTVNRIEAMPIELASGNQQFRIGIDWDIGKTE